MTPKIVMRQTKTAGWRVVYTAMSGHEYPVGRRLSREDADRVAAAAAKAYQAPVEVES